MSLQYDKTLAGLTDKSMSLVMHTWLSANTTLAPVYLAMLPLILLQSSWNQIRTVNVAMHTREQLIFSACNRYIQSIENIDFRETFHDFISKGDTAKCAYTLNCLSSTLKWYFLAIDYRSLTSKDGIIRNDESTLMDLSYAFLPFKLRSSIMTILRSEVSLDALFMAMLTNRRNDENKRNGSRRIFNCLVGLITSVSSQSHLFQCPKVRQALWACLWVCALLLDTESLNSLLSIKLHSHAKDPLLALEWLIFLCFNDENESIRSYGAHRVGFLLVSDNFKLLKLQSILWSKPGSSFSGDEIGREFIMKCDAWIDDFSRSLLPPDRQEFSNYLCHPFQDVLISSPYSHHRSSLLIFSSICQHVLLDSELGILFLTEAARRIIRFYLLPLMNQENRDQNGSWETHKISIQDIISSAAFEELQLLGDKYQLWTKLMERCEENFTPILFREFLSLRGQLERRSSRFLSHFIQIFLLKPSIKSGIFGHQDEPERYDGTLFFTDEALPAVISAAIAREEYDFLLACTSFRLGLVRFVRATRRNRGRHFTSEYIIGMVYRH